MRLLGISAFYHDSAAALVEDGRIVAAAQEERFTRKRHDAGFPAEAIRYCLDGGKVDLDEVDHVVFFEKPLIKFERLLETYLANAPRGFRSFRMAMPVWIKEKLFQKPNLEKALAAFAPSGKVDGQAAVCRAPPEPCGLRLLSLAVRGGGGADHGRRRRVGHHLGLDRPRQYAGARARDPLAAQLGLLYSAFTYYTGFKVNSGEYKVMGLAPYGEPKYAQLILDNVDRPQGGRLVLARPELFQLRDRSHHDVAEVPRPVRRAAARSRDLAHPARDGSRASVQKVTEEIMLRMTRNLAKTYGIKNLCLAGGVALNCVGNGKVLRDGAFKRIWIQPAAGDAGGSLGAALAAYHMHFGRPRHVNGALDGMQGAYLGPEFSQAEIEQRLAAAGAKFTVACRAGPAMSAPAMRSRQATRWAGSRAAWSSGRARSAPARSSAIRAIPRCRRT